MKKTNKERFINKLATEFSNEFNNIPVTVLPNGDIKYNNYVVKHNKDEFWGLYKCNDLEMLTSFFLKSSALIAAKVHGAYDFNNYHRIQHLDQQYYKNHNDCDIYKHNIKASTDFDKQITLLNRLECSEEKNRCLKKEISRMLTCTFV